MKLFEVILLCNFMEISFNINYNNFVTYNKIMEKLLFIQHLKEEKKKKKKL